MKRTPLISSSILFIALCATSAYWGMQWLQPTARPMVAPPAPLQGSVPLTAATALLGGVSTNGMSNFQLTGIIVADRPSESIAIIAVDGAAARPYRINREIKPGVRIQEVDRDHVTIEQNGTLNRLSLPIRPDATALQQP